MRLLPYQAVDDILFSSSRDEVVRGRGRPHRCGRNGVGLNELDYGSVVFRFQDNGRLEEVTQQALVMTLGKIAVPFASLAHFIRAHDEFAFERGGFIVSPRFGFAFDPSDPCWVTALASHCIETWRAL
jgi:hypothetical protein